GAGAVASGADAAEQRLASPRSADDDYVFCTASAKPVSYRDVSRRGLEPGLRAAGLPHLRWHDLRHLAASAMIAQGLSVTDVSRALGHANAAITATTYSHEFERAQRVDRTREAMERAFGGLSG